MKNINIFKKCKEIFSKNENVNLSKDIAFDFNGKDEVKIDGVGSVYYVKDNSPLPYLLFIPENLESDKRLVVEANNCESNEEDRLLRQASNTIKDLCNLKAPVLVPIIPSIENRPYYQQLSRDMFYEKDVLHIEEKFNNTISDALNKIEDKTGKKLDSKIFLNGYSSSGVFAQRFALFYPTRVDTLCVGGASGSIPIPTSEMPYPLGVEGLDGFDAYSYSKIRFRYYVGEYETINKAKYDENHPNDARKDIIDGKEVNVDAPMHDMTYFPRSVPTDVGKKYRDRFGEDYFTRVNNVVLLLKSRGQDIESTIIKKRAHKNLEIDGNKYQGVMPDAIKNIEQAYNESIQSLKEENKAK